MSAVVTQVGCMVVGASDLKGYCMVCYESIEARTSTILAAMIADHCKNHPGFFSSAHVLQVPPSKVAGKA